MFNRKILLIKVLKGSIASLVVSARRPNSAEKLSGLRILHFISVSVYAAYRHVSRNETINVYRSRKSDNALIIGRANFHPLLEVVRGLFSQIFVLIHASKGSFESLVWN